MLKNSKQYITIKDLRIDLFDWDIISAIAEHGGQSILAGFVRLSSFAINNIEKSTGVNLKPFFSEQYRKSKRDFHYSEKIRAYAPATVNTDAWSATVNAFVNL